VSGLEQIQFLSSTLYVLIFLAVLLRVVRRPTPAHVDMALFFGAAALLIVLGALPTVLGIAPPWWLGDITGALLMSLAYLLLRLASEFANVPPAIMRASEVGLVLSVVAIVSLDTPMPAPAALGLVAYFVLVIAYDTWVFVTAAIRTRGVTRRRLQALAFGSGSIGVVLVAAGGTVALPSLAWLWTEISALVGLASGVCYFVGFVPPTWLRRAWQEPELRTFLGRAASLPRLPDTYRIVRELELGAAASLGAPSASIGLWDRERRCLCFYYSPPPDGAVLPEFSGSRVLSSDGTLWEVEPSRNPISGRSFVEQRAQLVLDVERADPHNVSYYRAYHARSALAAPITVGDERLGVLVIYAPRAPFFANSDLELLQLLADQAAVILESRALIDEAARVRAREEATRLKDDFLSSAAHDLKTPLTGLVTQAQLLRRRAERDPLAPVDRVGLDRMLEQSLRLRDLVLELLDVSRLEHGSLIGERSPTDLAELADEIVSREDKTWSRVELARQGPVMATVDRPRLEQVITNLVENALKYSPDGGAVHLRLRCEADEARIDVFDAGIGIAAEDLPLVFERFHRGRNVDDRRFAGMGLGLYITRGIVEQHGGRIWVESTPGQGSAFHVALPLTTAPAGTSSASIDRRAG
jgi:signal transduction histidine kinase